MATARAFGDPNLAPADFSQFSSQEVDADTKAKGIEQLEPVPPARSTLPMDLSNVIGNTATSKMLSAGEIVFHTVGDTGGIQKPEPQFAVAEAMAKDLAASGACLWYHLGDVVYYFGLDQYYFEQFYDPYRNYNAPIFAIPGNHDGALYQNETEKTLQGFMDNFCTTMPTQSPDSQGAVRTTMDQPGVYFTLNCPFVKFIGLYSNTSEGATEGVIANSKIGEAQLTFLQQQLQQAVTERANGQWRALVIATHHPPFTGSRSHVPSPAMLKQIDNACMTAGIQPDLYLSGHAHLYERYTRTVKNKQIPFIVAGMGGYYNLPGLKPGSPAAPEPTPQSGKDASGNPLTLECFNNNTFGFLRISISEKKIITGTFVTVDPQSGTTGVGDSFTADLNANTVSGKCGSAGSTGATSAQSTKSTPAKKAHAAPAVSHTGTPTASHTQKKSATKGESAAHKAPAKSPR